jgi:hypothetical protein
MEQASTGGNPMSRLIGVALLVLPIGSSIALAEDLKLPPLKRQPTPQAVIDEHYDALNKCDWNRLMATVSPDYQLNLPDGVVVKGREEAGKLFANFVKPVDQGGLCGMKFTPEQTFVVGETLNIQWKAESEFLAEPYKGSDAYETHDGLIAAMVSTFKGADLKVKRPNASHSEKETEVVWLARELNEALERQTATSEVLQSIR